jgi:uncharacterized SAM-binding protein YcdF (DUF218 family)
MLFRFLLKQLLFPPGILILLLVAGWLLRRRAPKAANTCMFLGVLGLALMSLPVVVQHGASVLETDPPLPMQAWPGLAQQAQAIVVLGAGRERGDPAWAGVDQPTGVALERMRYAARLAKASGLPVLTSGGLHFGEPPSEAEIMAGSLKEDFSVTTRWLEPRSRTTWENATFSAELLKAHGIERVVVVTQAWHMARARWSFERAGLQVVSAPVGFLGGSNGRPLGGWVPDAKAFWQNGQLLNEAVGQLGYRWFY